MIKDIIRYIYENNDFSSKGIAEGLDVSEQIIEQYKEKLILNGYIKKDDGCTSTKCEKCSCGCSQKSLNPVVQWEITDKGFKLIKNK
ncbi:hypothetical protein BH721_04935 [Clostridium baratii]|uniref:FeoC-like transcriptional regulator n=1 Tax=Clostridium baratii TaxID=1561 RepID=UPI0009A435C3|nr:FeoC-like transcriptional regulator [Clostridium baratii]OPF52605.1 hypothetical protein A1M12_11145 [Clostridium baratii]OPF56054.1 hypothetical protein BH721_04935 [Clostridium baratii]OPF58351.1 hypothetical protein BH724_05640 [Clostridium baratii]OPF59564.1 hypothetical protein BH725_02985 [Clostridium baratii]